MTVDQEASDGEEIQPSKGLTLAQQRQFDLVSFRVSWSQAILFGCYEVSPISSEAPVRLQTRTVPAIDSLLSV